MIDEAPTHRWFRFRLRTMLVLVAVAASLFGWLRWHALQVRERIEFVAYLKGLEHESNPTTTWLMTWDDGDEQIPFGWRLLGATNEDWGTWLVCNRALTSKDLERAARLLPDCKIEVNRQSHELE